MDSFSDFPCKNTVQSETETCLTSEIGTGSGEPNPYGRPKCSNEKVFINVTGFLFKNIK